MRRTQRIGLPALALVLAAMGLGSCISSQGSCPAAPRSGPGVSLLPIGHLRRIASGPLGLWAIRERRRPDHLISSLVRIDPASGRIMGRAIGLPGVPTRLAVGKRAVWVATGPRSGARAVLLRIDVRMRRITDRIDLGVGVFDIAAGEGAVWGISSRSDAILRIDPATARVTSTVVGADVSNMHVGAGAVWVTTSAPGRPGIETLRIDPATGHVSGRGDFDVAAVGPHAVWAYGKRGLTRIDSRTLSPNGPTLGGDLVPNMVVLGDGEMWVGRPFVYCEPVTEGVPLSSYGFYRLDPRTMRALSGPVFVVRNFTGNPVLAGRSLWMVYESETGGVERVDLRAADRLRASPTPLVPPPAQRSS